MARYNPTFEVSPWLGLLFAPPAYVLIGIGYIIFWLVSFTILMLVWSVRLLFITISLVTRAFRLA